MQCNNRRGLFLTNGSPSASAWNVFNACRRIPLVALLGLFLLGQPDLALFGQAFSQEESPVDQVERAIQQVIEKNRDSVVAITRVRKGTHGDPTDPKFVPHEYAAGVIVDEDGLVLTTYHSLGDPEQNDYYVWVRRRPHKVVKLEKAKRVEAADPWTDLAVLRIDAKGLRAVKFSDAPQLRVGQLVVTIGDPYSIVRDGVPKATWGIISSLSASAVKDPRSDSESKGADTIHHYGTLIQVDSRLKFATSGAALLNRDGELVGLTTSIAALSRFQATGSFAIPCDLAFQKTIRTLMSGRQAEFGFLGVGPRDLTDEQRRRGMTGVIIEQVVAGTPAAKAGLLIGDIITHVNGAEVSHAGELFRELGKQKVGTEALLRLERSNGVGRPPSVIRTPVVLAKKYIATRRPEFAQIPPETWRGMRVDYATAIPGFSNRSGYVQEEGCIAVVEVDRDSAAWRAGLRPWTFISHVGKQRVSTPDQFYSQVRDSSETVHLIMTANYGEKTPNRYVAAQ